MTLIERLQAADGPSFAIDMEIAQADGWQIVPDHYPNLVKGDFRRHAPLAYTASLDAAMSLFPDEETAVRELYEVMCWLATEGPIFKPTLWTVRQRLIIGALRARGVK